MSESFIKRAKNGTHHNLAERELQLMQMQSYWRDQPSCPAIEQLSASVRVIALQNGAALMQI